MHHLPVSPAKPSKPLADREALKLSTDVTPSGSQPVDISSEAHWIGCVVPKRHARRAVTRNLVKRQVRAALQRRLGELPPGLWLVRLRQPFPVAEFPSAASPALAGAVRAELDALLAPRAR